MSHSSLALLKVGPMGLQRQTFWGFVFLVQEPSVGRSLGRTSIIVIILPLVGHLPGGMSLDSTASLPLLPSHCGSFFVVVGLVVFLFFGVFFELI